MQYIWNTHQKEHNMKSVKRTNKIDNADLFTTAASAHYQKHIKTQSKQSLKFINEKIDWKKLLQQFNNINSLNG